MQEVFEKITDRLLEVRKKNKYELYDCRANIGIDQAEKIVNEVAAEYNNGWIPVSERLPKTNTMILCCTDDGCIDVDFLCKMTGVFSKADDCNKKVVAWQPLPEGYECRNE